MAAARLRKALAECHRLSLRSEPPEPAASSGSPCMQPNQLASWAELATQAHIRTRVQPDRSLQIQLPGELLNADTTPSIRLLSLVHEGGCPGSIASHRGNTRNAWKQSRPEQFARSCSS